MWNINYYLYSVKTSAERHYPTYIERRSYREGVVDRVDIQDDMLNKYVDIPNLQEGRVEEVVIVEEGALQTSQQEAVDRKQFIQVCGRQALIRKKFNLFSRAKVILLNCCVFTLLYILRHIFDRDAREAWNDRESEVRRGGRREGGPLNNGGEGDRQAR